MSNIARAMVSIQGSRTLLWHHFGPDAIPLERETDRTGVAGNDPEEWRKTVLMTKDRQLYILPTSVFSCLREAAKFTKKGRGSIQSNLSATLQVEDETILVDRYLPEEPLPTEATEPAYLHICMVKNPQTKGRNVRYRIAASPGWRLGFTLQWDRSIVSTNEMQAVLRDAGQLVGIGNGRVLGFGRFAVEAFNPVA